MTRSFLSLISGLLVFGPVYLVIALALPWPIKPMFWNQQHEVALLAILAVASGCGAAVAVRLARHARLAHALVGAVPPLVLSIDWLRVGDPLWLVVLIALSGVAGAGGGAMLSERKFGRKPASGEIA